MQHARIIPSIKSSKLEPLLRPVHAFLSAESTGGLLLMAAAVTALVWANSPWSHSYHAFWHAKLGVGMVGGFQHAMTLEHWVNDGLMVVFFLLVGLEIKRELLMGELASVRRASLPIAAAIGCHHGQSARAAGATDRLQVTVVSAPSRESRSLVEQSLVQMKATRADVQGPLVPVRWDNPPLKPSATERN